MSADHLLTRPDSASLALSIRAKALLFHAPRSLAVLEQVERVAASDATALVIGETGTGKELVARHVHKRSGREGPFVAVNCWAFSETLIDAELFCHEAGAFTGASQSRAGWFEAAHGGTLFLEELGDLPMALQGTQLSPDAREALLAYPWPANIRELENVIHYALIVCRDGIVRTSDCRFSPLGFISMPAPAAAAMAEHAVPAARRAASRSCWRRSNRWWCGWASRVAATTRCRRRGCWASRATPCARCSSATACWR